MWKWLYGSHLLKRIDMLSTFASALAYSFVLSIIPFLVLAFALTSELFGTLNPYTYSETLARVLPLQDDAGFSNHIIQALETTWHSNTARTFGLLFRHLYLVQLDEPDRADAAFYFR